MLNRNETYNYAIHYIMCIYNYIYVKCKIYNCGIYDCIVR